MASAQSTLVDSAAFSFGLGTGNALPSTGSPLDVNLSTFNESLGTLTGIAISLTASGTVYAEAGNNTSSPIAFTNSQATLNFGVSGPDGSSIAINPQTSPLFSGTAPAMTFGYITGSTPFGPLTPADVSVSSPNFSLYETAGPGGIFVLQFNSDGQPGSITSMISGPSGIFTSGNATVNGTADVTFTYTQIPEPSTYAAILGAVCLGFAVIRRKRILP